MSCETQLFMNFLKSNCQMIPVEKFLKAKEIRKIIKSLKYNDTFGDCELLTKVGPFDRFPLKGLKEEPPYGG